jgi:hypothetical protein
MDIEIPAYPGGSCQNKRCRAGRERILSEREADRIYPVKDKYSWWPLPPQATHVCTSCGFVYAGVGETFANRARYTEFEEFELLEDWEWNHEAQFEETVREATKAWIRGAPQEANPDIIARGAARFVAGVDTAFARDVMTAMEEFSGSGRNLAEYM